MTTEQRIAKYFQRGCVVASVEEAVWLIENAQELGIDELEVDDAYKYILRRRAQELVPAWIARGVADMDRAGEFD